MLKNKFLISTLLFNIFWSVTLLTEIYKNDHSFSILLVSALAYSLLHLNFVAKDFSSEVYFMLGALFVGVCAETLMSNIGIYHFGLLESPGLEWPPAWIAALWLIFPVYLVNSVTIIKRMPITGAYLGAMLTFGTYYLLGDRLDLIFFHKPFIKTSLFFIATWYLLIRFLFWFHDKTEAWGNNKFKSEATS
jgi:hypothetical protein